MIGVCVRGVSCTSGCLEGELECSVDGFWTEFWLSAVRASPVREVQDKGESGAGSAVPLVSVELPSVNLV